MSTLGGIKTLQHAFSALTDFCKVSEKDSKWQWQRDDDHGKHDDMITIAFVIPCSLCFSTAHLFLSQAPHDACIRFPSDVEEKTTAERYIVLSLSHRL